MLTDDHATFDDLPDAEHTLLWAIRVWVIGHCRQQDLSARISAALQDRGAEGALGYLEGFMWALSRGALRPLELLCLCRTDVSADERLLLDAFSLLQQDEADAAQSLLCTLLTDPAAAIAIRSAEGLAHEFLGAGLVLPWEPKLFGQLQVTDLHRVLH